MSGLLMGSSDILRRVLTPELSHYQVLGVGTANAADPQVLTEARRKLALQVHPDRFAQESGELQRAAHDAMARVNQAYAVLDDPKARRKYDLTYLAKYYTPCGACKGLGSSRKQKSFTKIELVPCLLCGGAGHFPKA